MLPWRLVYPAADLKAQASHGPTNARAGAAKVRGSVPARGVGTSQELTSRVQSPSPRFHGLTDRQDPRGASSRIWPDASGGDLPPRGRNERDTAEGE